MSDTVKLLAACVEYRAKMDELKDENANHQMSLRNWIDKCATQAIRIGELERELFAFKRSNERIIADYNALLRDEKAAKVDLSVAYHNHEKTKAELAALREQAIVRDAEIDMWASRCAAAIYMLPESVTGGQLKEAQNKFYLMLEKARKGAQP